MDVSSLLERDGPPHVERDIVTPTRTVRRDPLGSFWYLDGVLASRCKVCLELQILPHRPECQLGQVLTLLTAISDSPAMMGCHDIERLGHALELLGFKETEDA